MVRLTIPAKAEFIALGRLALSGLVAAPPGPALGRGRRRPEARPHRGVHERRPACLRRRRRDRRDQRTSSIPTGSWSRSPTTARGSISSRRRRPPGTTSSSRVVSGSRSSARSPTSSRSRGASREARRCASSSACRRRSSSAPGRPRAATRQRRAQVARATTRTLVSRGLMDEMRRLAEPLEGQRVVHLSATRVRRRRRGDQLHARAADGGRRPRRRVADHARRGRVLPRHEDDPQRAAGRSAGRSTAEELEIFARYNAENAAELAADDVRLRDRPRPAAGRR